MMRLRYRSVNQRLPRRVNPRRGSTLLIVLALLSLLVLLASTIAFTSRIEVMSANNFVESMQRKVVTLTTLNNASLMISQNVNGFEALGSPQIPGNPAGRKATRYNSNALSDVVIVDASGRVNINAADSVMLERLITQVAKSHNVSASPRAMADAIVSYRSGRDKSPGEKDEDDNLTADKALNADVRLGLAFVDDKVEAANREARLSESCEGMSIARKNALTFLRDGVDDPEEFVSDIRRPAFGDDRRFDSPEDLLRIPGFTAELVDALRPYITVFSISFPVLPTDSKGNYIELVDLNRASAEEIYDALSSYYGASKDDNLLRQFAVNIVDARDPDFIPTTLPNGDDSGLIIGLERTPFITTVYAESRSLHQADWGEYVQIHNPWSETINLDGWSLRVNGASYALNGAVAAGGYLIVTDNYDDQIEDDDEESIGLDSFYDVHSVVSAGMHKRIVEFRNFDLPNRAGRENKVELLRSSEIVDQFIYTPQPGMDTLKGFVRGGEGHVREVRIADAIPFTLRPTNKAPSMAGRALTGPQDLEFTTLLELFEVFAGFASDDEGWSNPWSFPVMGLPSSDTLERAELAADRRFLDAGILDLFTIEMTEKPGSAEIQEERARGGSKFLREGRALMGGSSAGYRLVPYGSEVKSEQMEALAFDRFYQAGRGSRTGMINVNTAAREALVAAGFTSFQAETIVRKQAEQSQNARSSDREVSRPVYRSLSELFADEDLWKKTLEDTCEQVEAFSQVLGRVSLGSRAFMLEGMSHEDAQSTQSSRSGLRVEAILAFDQREPEVVQWKFSTE